MMEKFTQKIELIIPTRDNKGELVAWLPVLKQAQKIMCQYYGGCTVVKGSGSWMGEELIEEDVYIVSSFHNSSPDPVFKFAEIVKTILFQDCVTVIENNKMYLI